MSADHLNFPEDVDGKAEQQPNGIPAPVRERLDDTRAAITHKFSVLTEDNEELDGYINVGLFPDGRPGEVFIKIAKQGSTISGLMNTVGILTSMLLQYGVQVEVIARKLEHSRFEPSGRTQNSDIRYAKSLVDYIFRWLGTEFSDEYRQESNRGQ